jgi:hypothetical protein
LTPPDFAQYRVQDLFKSLGPVAIFSAKHHWTVPRTIQLVVHSSDKGDGFGFMVRGDAPVVIAGVDGGSLAEVDFYIFKLNDAFFGYLKFALKCGNF